MVSESLGGTNSVVVPVGFSTFIASVTFSPFASVTGLPFSSVTATVISDVSVFEEESDDDEKEGENQND